MNLKNSISSKNYFQFSNQKVKAVIIIILFSYLFILQSLFSQSIYSSTFMGSSLIFMPTNEEIGYKNLVFRFNHRFGNAKSGLKDFYGLDEGANTQLSLDYGLTDRWMMGIARTSFQKTTEIRTKYSILRDPLFPFQLSFFGVAGQENTDQSITYSIYSQTWTGNTTIDTKLNSELNDYNLTTVDKRSYLISLLFSKKFTSIFSLQVSPIYVHRNFTTFQISNARTGIDIGGRIKLSKRVDFTFEAIFTPKRDYFGTNYTTEDLKTYDPSITQYTADQINTGFNNKTITISDAIYRNIYLDEHVKYASVPVALGVDIETGGHVFQFFVSNSRAIAHTQLLRGGEYDFFKKEYCLGFNILRQFSLETSQEKW